MAEEFDFDGPASIVKDQYTRSVTLADSLKAEMSGFLDGLRQSVALYKRLTTAQRPAQSE